MKNQNISVPKMQSRILLIDANGNASVTQWVGDCIYRDGKPVYPHGRPENGFNAVAWAELPSEDDSRWKTTRPPLDTRVLTLCPWYPSGKLNVQIEEKQSKPFFRNPNHPPFHAMKGWMFLDELKSELKYLDNWKPEKKEIKEVAEM